jgi:PKHD-type hydroxylase
MNDTLEFFYYDSLVDKSLCDRFMARFKDSKFIDGQVTGGSDNLAVRDSAVHWAPPMDLIECVMFRMGMKANEMPQWRFLVDGTEPNVQITRYEPGQHYTSHIDSVMTADERQRKLTVVLLLNDPDEYSGGDLKVIDNVIPTKNKGTIIIFPSFMAHCVTPITSGVRYSAVCWLTGPKFK